MELQDKIIRERDLRAADGLSDSQRIREIKAGRYPAPFKLSSDPQSRAIGWSFLAVQKWIAERKAQSDSADLAVNRRAA